jgi:hypothetical protein
VKLSFKEGRDNTMSMVVEVEEEGEVESRDCLGEPHPRGNDLETLMPQVPRHQFKLR